MTFIKSIALAAATALTLSCADESKKQKAMETLDDTPKNPTAKVEKSDQEWREILTPEQYRILRQAGTEAPGGKVYQEFKKQGEGSYHCAGCNALLFSSKEKFNADCGWPSFYDPANAQNVTTRPDISGGRIRTEVICSICDGHLGHVFEGEGYDTPTDKRYCINGTGLKFVPAK
jgi:peptide-methionine (R)-S-oxide reductase